MGVTVELSYAEMQVAIMIGGQRQIQNMKLDNKHSYGLEDGPIAWGNHIIGCIGEMAIAKHLNKYWCGAVGNYQSADVDRYQVRATMHKNGRLILHPEDDACIFFLVIVEKRLCHLAGWMHADDARHEKYWKDIGNGRPAFWVPQDDLMPMGAFGDAF